MSVARGGTPAESALVRRGDREVGGGGIASGTTMGILPPVFDAGWKDERMIPIQRKVLGAVRGVTDYMSELTEAQEEYHLLQREGPVASGSGSGRGGRDFGGGARLKEVSESEEDNEEAKREKKKKRKEKNKESKKLDHRRLGPFRISEKVSSHAFRLELPRSMQLLHPVFHVSLLERHIANTIPNRSEVPPPAVYVEDGDEPEYEVAAILDSRLRRRKLQYLVQWRGYEDQPQENSWEPSSNLDHSPDIVRRFHLDNPDKPGP